jgi:hypothetical protein
VFGDRKERGGGQQGVPRFPRAQTEKPTNYGSALDQQQPKIIWKFYFQHKISSTRIARIPSDLVDNGVLAGSSIVYIGKGLPHTPAGTEVMGTGHLMEGAENADVEMEGNKYIDGQLSDSFAVSKKMNYEQQLSVTANATCKPMCKPSSDSRMAVLLSEIV